jgi:acetoin utilization protein AcuB
MSPARARREPASDQRRGAAIRRGARIACAAAQTARRACRALAAGERAVAVRVRSSRGRGLAIPRRRGTPMTKAIPTIKPYMTMSPHSIGLSQNLAHAHKVMREHRIRHLPVLDGGVLVGMISERDLHLVETLRDVDPEKVTVEEAMSSVVYTVSPAAPLDEVAKEMAEHKYGSAVVMDNGKLVGVFTPIDGMRALADLLETRLTH